MLAHKEKFEETTKVVIEKTKIPLVPLNPKDMDYKIEIPTSLTTMLMKKAGKMLPYV